MTAYADHGRYWESEWAGGFACGPNRWFAVYFVRWPFALLRASPTALLFHMRASWQPDRGLSRASVIRVHVSRFLFAWYLRFEHEERGLPKHVVFGTWNGQRLVTELRAMGYPVA